MPSGVDPLVLVAQWVFGLLIKRWPLLKAWPNKLVPIFNYVLAVLIGLTQGIAHAGFGEFFGGFGNVLVNAALNTLVSTGTHSFGKNFWQVLKRTT